MSLYTDITNKEQLLFRKACADYLDVNLSDENWNKITKFMVKINIKDISLSSKEFCEMAISYDASYEDESLRLVFIADFIENMSDYESMEAINITYDIMSNEQKGFMLDYVSGITGYIFEQEQIDLLFATAPSDKAFTNFTSGRPDSFDAQLFIPFIWMRLIGKDSPDMFELEGHQEILKSRIDKEGRDLFKDLYDHHSIVKSIYG